MTDTPGALEVFVPGAIWLVRYPVRYAGTTFDARMTVIRLADGRLILHSPCEITPALKAGLDGLGSVGWIVAPGTFHHLHAGAAKAAFPGAKLLICPGVEKKQPRLEWDAMLGDAPYPDWNGEVSQVLVKDNRVIRELVFVHHPSRTLIVTDLIELIGDRTPNVGWLLKLYWKAMTFMWNKPRPAPEYRIGWSDRRAAAASLREILAWEFDKIVLAHGDLVTENARAVAEEAWGAVLKNG